MRRRVVSFKWRGDDTSTFRGNPGGGSDEGRRPYCPGTGHERGAIAGLFREEASWGDGVFVKDEALAGMRLKPQGDDHRRNLFQQRRRLRAPQNGASLRDRFLVNSRIAILQIFICLVRRRQLRRTPGTSVGKTCLGTHVQGAQFRSACVRHRSGLFTYLREVRDWSPTSSS